MNGKHIVVLVVVMLMALTGNVFAAKRIDPTNRQTWLNNVTDDVATFGKNPRAAQNIKRQRHNERQVARQHANQIAKQKRNKQQQKAMLDKINNS